MKSTAPEFDREPSLEELLAPTLRANVEKALHALLSNGYRITDTHEATLSRDQNLLPGTKRVPLRADMRVIGYLEAITDNPALLTGTAQLLQLLLDERRRFVSAHSLPQAVSEDYRALVRRLEADLAEQADQIDIHRRQLFQAQKTSSIGKLAAGMGREIANPLGFVRTNLAAALAQLKVLLGLGQIGTQGDMESLRTYWDEHKIGELLLDFNALLSEASQSVERVARIVADLRQVSAHESIGKIEVGLNEHVRVACNAASVKISHSAEIELELRSLPRIVCDAVRINQALLNLLLNAAYAVTAPGKIHVRTYHTQDEVHVSVTDDGCGIPPETLDRVFDPFFTTRDINAGSMGLGLTVARDIVKAHGGRIEVESRLGEGSTFTLILPIAP